MKQGSHDWWLDESSFFNLSEKFEKWSLLSSLSDFNLEIIKNLNLNKFIEMFVKQNFVNKTSKLVNIFLNQKGDVKLVQLCKPKK